MNHDKRPTLKRLDILFLSFFGVGFVPFAPGTWGTLAIMPILYGLGRLNPPFFFFIPFIVITTIISCFLAHRVQEELKSHDPQWIVIDEVLGMSTAWLFTREHHFSHLVLLFVLFRFFDIFKIWPASFLDRDVKNGIGTIVDDLVSGIYAGLTYLVITFFINLS